MLDAPQFVNKIIADKKIESGKCDVRRVDRNGQPGAVVLEGMIEGGAVTALVVA